MTKNLYNLLFSIVAIIIAIIGGAIIAKTGIFALAILPILAVLIILATKIFTNPFWGFLLIIFFLPFERVPTINFLSVDIKINTVLGLLTIVAWFLALMFNAKKWKIQPNPLFIPLALFICAMLLSITQALNLGRSLEVFVFILFTIMLAIMTINMITDKERLEKIIKVLLWSSILVGLFGLFQFAGDIIGLPQSITLLKTGYTSAVFGFPRIQAFSEEPLYFANYLMIPISLALSYYFSKSKILKRYLLIIMLTLLLINFVLTVSRGGYLGLIVVLALFLFFYWRQIFSWRNLAIIVVGAIVIWGVYFALSRGQPKSFYYFVRQATLKDTNPALASESVLGRLDTYTQALAAYSRHHNLGIGLGNFGPFFTHSPFVKPITGWPVVNNEYLEILAETGLIGFITFMLLLSVIIWRSLLAIKKAQEPFLKATMFGLFAAFLGILTQYNFFSTLYIIHIWILIGLMIGVQNLIFANVKTESTKLKTAAHDN